jgi:hypothetical protein
LRFFQGLQLPYRGWIFSFRLLPHEDRGTRDPG